MEQKGNINIKHKRKSKLKLKSSYQKKVNDARNALMFGKRRICLEK